MSSSETPNLFEELGTQTNAQNIEASNEKIEEATLWFQKLVGDVSSGYISSQTGCPYNPHKLFLEGQE